MSIINVTVDGGITKKVLKEGQGLKPTAGSTVAVQYVGTLVNGTEFDSSSGGYPFTFELGKGMVIKGWDKGIATMKVGEKAILTISPEYGYGSEDSEDIPANSTLIFEVELVSATQTPVKGGAAQVNADMARLEQLRKEREESAKQKEIEKKEKEEQKAKATAAAKAKLEAKDKRGKKK